MIWEFALHSLMEEAHFIYTVGGLARGINWIVIPITLDYSICAIAAESAAVFLLSAAAVVHLVQIMWLQSITL